MKKCFLVFVFLILSSSVLLAAESDSIQIKGSDTMVNLGQAWAETYMGKNPKAFVAITGGGSGTGIASLINGTCDIAECSRNMKDKEVQSAREKNIEPKEFIVALDGIAVVVNPKNPISKLTIAELSDIFTGKIKNWKELGGSNAPIVLLSREVNSGTHVYFKEHVLRKGDEKVQVEFTPTALLMPSSQSIADEIDQNPNTIGYYGIGYISPKQKAIAVAKDNNSPYIQPSIESVSNGEYPISRPLFMYTNGEPKGLTKDFIDFILSDAGQKVVLEQDFVPVKTKQENRLYQ